jgi:D-glycero-D-manno-heptose 1,7-bisphosphate phosphatase
MAQTDAGRPAVFLDRDGTIIEDADYLTDPEQIRILPGVLSALKRLRDSGYLLIVVTNQSAIARGWLTEDGLKEVHSELDRRLHAGGAHVDAYYCCPHLPEGTVPRYAVACDCRKPKPGLLNRAAQEWDVDMGSSFMVGDSVRDAEAGRHAGCRSILVGSAPESAEWPSAPGLAEAADLILGAGPAGRPSDGARQ